LIVYRVSTDLLRDVFRYPAWLRFSGPGIMLSHGLHRPLACTYKWHNAHGQLNIQAVQYLMT